MGPYKTHLESGPHGVDWAAHNFAAAIQYMDVDRTLGDSLALEGFLSFAEAALARRWQGRVGTGVRRLRVSQIVCSSPVRNASVSQFHVAPSSGRPGEVQWPGAYARSRTSVKFEPAERAVMAHARPVDLIGPFVIGIWSFP